MKNKIKMLITFFPLIAFGSEFNIYVDADFSVNKESANSIYNGAKSSLGHYIKHNKIKAKFNLIKLDHRGNTRRSLANFKRVIADPKAIAVLSGVHSPPLITNNKFINENKVLTLVPWAAGAPVTRSETNENWIYRLSIDDAQAGGFIAKYALKKINVYHHF